MSKEMTIYEMRLNLSAFVATMIEMHKKKIIF